MEVKSVEYDPPQNVWSSVSDWDAYGNLEVEWKIIEKDEKVLDSDLDLDYIDSLVKQDVLRAIQEGGTGDY